MSATQTAADEYVGAAFLAADIGGTCARVALVRADARGAIEILDHRAYRCADFDGPVSILADFLAAPGRARVHDAAIACAGVVRDGAVLNANLRWPVALADLRALGIARIALVNDFVAVAHATQCLDAAHARLLTPAAAAAAAGPTLVIGPGTGLGAALRVPHRGATLVLSSETGQQAFAPGNAREIAVLRHLLGESPHVANEHLLSGPGLLRLYRTLCALDAAPPRQARPADVVDAARCGNDAQAREAVLRFCAMLGSLIGDLVLAGGATSAFIAGGVVPRLSDFLAESDFGARLVNKGILRELLQRVPVRLLEDPHQGVIGAASWYLQRER